MIENVSTQLTVFNCLCPLPASRKGLRPPLRSALFGEGGRDWRPCLSKIKRQVCVSVSTWRTAGESRACTRKKRFHVTRLI